jgi:hypothetical protein
VSMQTRNQMPWQKVPRAQNKARCICLV